MVSEHTSADSIFHAALELPPDRRPAFLDGACGEDAALRARLERLLAAQAKDGDFLESPALELGAAGEDPAAEASGQVIGPYTLVEQLGEGGFGVVFLAEQQKPVRRRVALKVVKPGMDTRACVARFEAERQALALMDHPHIAKVLDAGATDAGRPYFVMELVRGVPITEYCDQCQLTTRERLELFVTVCQAVQHAHQKGIIHRDLKPTNVLVAIQDGKPAPKIIDFGVAKAIGEQSLTERTLTTAFAQMIGSPLYMSPEQAELCSLGVDTRSDIYSLGVLLYELLAGSTPFDRDRLHAASYDEMRRIIREEEPTRPSARISTLKADLATTVAEKRRTDPRRLIQTVRGELDWIVMKCLDKDRNRRYDSAGSLQRDVEHYLNDEQVEANPPSTVYRMRKFARRNRVALAFAWLLLSSLVYLAYSNATIKRERDAKATALIRAQATANLLQEMLGAAGPDLDVDTEYTVRKMKIYDDVRIAYFLTSTGREEEAAEFVRKADLDAKRLTDPVSFVDSLYFVALMQRLLRDEAGYRASCKAMMDVPAENLDFVTHSRAIWTSCMAANALDDMNSLVIRADAFVAENSSDDRHFALAVLGAALYRAGRYERAAKCLEESGAASPSDAPPHGFNVIIFQRLFLAMTRWQLGHRVAAREVLAESQIAVNKELQSELIAWNRRATLEVLVAEAKSLINPKEAEEAVDATSPKPPPGA